MRKRLFFYTTLMLFAGLFGFLAVSTYITHNNNLTFAKDKVIEAARIYAGLYRADVNLLSFVHAGGNTRVTIISSYGAVLADSHPIDDPEYWEESLTLPELQAALLGFPEAFVRHCKALGVDLIYYAVIVDSGDDYIFIRTAIPFMQIEAYMLQSLPLLVIVLLVITLVCFAFSHRIINRITRPFESVEEKLRLLSRGEYSPGTYAGPYREINAIVVEIDEVAQVLHDNLTALRDEKTKAEYILNNIGDGIFAVADSKTIALINKAALDIFDVTPDIVNKNMIHLSYDKALITAVDDCVNHEKSTLFELTRKGRIYLVTVKRLPGAILTVVILSDVTDNRESAKQREEFFANASHELKTPLTAIKGFNELAALGNKDENILKYISGITRETDRMLSLISDMLKLSELEHTQNQSINCVPVELEKIVSEVRETLSAAIGEKSVNFETVGTGLVEADPGHVYELVKNLAENAVRYNNQGGRVSLTIESDNKNTWLHVFDDGIGISPEEQSRIFERFYRVEKSRCDLSGGTGLGLSIVKHICALYGWKLSLKSKLGVGTEVMVKFN